MSLYSIIEIFLIVIAGGLMIVGNVSGIGDPAAGMPLLIVGTILGIVALLLSLLITVSSREDKDVDDIIFINSFIYPLLVGIVLSIGSLFDPDPATSAEAQLAARNVQSIFLDLGLIMGLFIIFYFVWHTIKERWWDFLELEDIDFTSDADKADMPKFLLVALILGSLYGGLFIIFKLIFILGGYNITSYVFMAIVFVMCVVLSFVLRWNAKRPPRTASKKIPAPKTV